MKKYWLRLLTPNIILILFFEDGRKVGFGIWGFIISTWFAWEKIITGDIWFLCFLLSGSVITGGTMFDTYMKTKTPCPPAPPIDLNDTK